MPMMRSQLSLLTGLFVSTLNASPVEILEVKASCEQRLCNFQVTLKHDDSGWDHYANAWQLVTEEGQILGTRTLYHPHVDEQPFTRSLSGIKIPETVNKLLVRASDSVDGYNSQPFYYTFDQ